MVFLQAHTTHYAATITLFRWISRETKANVLVGNYRGVGESSGFAYRANDLMKDGEAMIEYLFHKNVDPKNILVHGIGIGGGVGTKLVADYHRKGKEIALCNHNSFSRLSDATSSQICQLAKARKIFPINFFTKGAIKLTTRVAFKVLGWEMEIHTDWKEIPKERKMLIFGKKDEIISYEEASLQKKLPDGSDSLEILLDTCHSYPLPAATNIFPEYVARAKNMLSIEE